MSAALSDDLGARVRERLVVCWTLQRWRALGFTLLTLALTPVFVAGALVVFVVVSPYAHHGPSLLLSGREVAISSILWCLLGMGLAVVVRHDPRRGPRRWTAVGAAGALWLAMAALGEATPLPRTAPGLFWPAFVALGLAVLGVLLRAYEPAESYYLGWLGIFDDPFTFRDDIDRRHVAYGFAGAVVGLIVDAYEHILRSAWLTLPLASAETSEACSLLTRLAGAAGPLRQEGLGAANPGTTARALRLLERLGLVRLAHDGLRLTDDGSELASEAVGPREG